MGSSFFEKFQRQARAGEGKEGVKMHRFIPLSMIVSLLALQPCGCTPLLVGAAAGAGAGTTAVAKERRETSTPTKVGTVAVNVVYVPAKVLFAGGGAALGAIVYLVSLGDTRSAMRIWKPSLGGTYVLTPSMVEGRERIRFLGG